MLPSEDELQPTNALDEVRQLAACGATCELFKVTLDELRRHGLDSDDLRDLIQLELGLIHFLKTKPTERHYPGTYSDYFSIWINECNAKMFLKLLVYRPAGLSARLVITSFKKDNRYEL